MSRRYINSSLAKNIRGVALSTPRVTQTAILRNSPMTRYLYQDYSTMTSSQRAKVAVLYQAQEAPAVHGIRKPMKPGGYKDSGSDIAYVLQQTDDVEVITSEANPDPKSQEGWCFPDSESGILSALSKGATHLWANTILYASHPLQVSETLDQYAANIKVVGQPPLLVDQFDDKNFVNNLLREDGRFRLPRSWVLDSSQATIEFLGSLTYPIVAKPIRGRGSQGVKVCHDADLLSKHLEELLIQSPQAMLEEYLSGEEGTVTVMPPSQARPRYWSLPIVVRFDHQDGVAPYNATVLVSANSRVPSEEEFAAKPEYQEICEMCELAAEKLQTTAPIRIDVRQFKDEPGSKLAIFDVNMKPNMTGPGRPGREAQASLTALAASKLGWDYPQLLKKILTTAQPLQELRSRTVE